MSSIGMNRVTGQWLRDGAHIQQSINDILTTRLGARVLARDYGSDVPSRVDAPMNAINVLALYADIYAALQPRLGMFGQLGEPRFGLRKMSIVDATVTGSIKLQLTGVVYPNGHKGDRTPSPASRLTSFVVTLAEKP